MTDYSRMTDQEFDEILEEIVGDMSAAEILSYGDVNTILREELNNVVLETWAEKNADKAYPKPDLSDLGFSESDLEVDIYLEETPSLIITVDRGDKEIVEELTDDYVGLVDCLELPLRGVYVSRRLVEVARRSYRAGFGSLYFEYV